MLFEFGDFVRHTVVRLFRFLGRPVSCHLTLSTLDHGGDDDDYGDGGGGGDGDGDGDGVR